MLSNIKQELYAITTRYATLLDSPNGNDINHNIGPDEVIFDMSYLLKLIENMNIFNNSKLYDKEVELWTNIYGLVNYFLTNKNEDPVELNKSILELPEANYGDSFSLYARYKYMSRYDTVTDNFININSPIDREKLERLFKLVAEVGNKLKSSDIKDISDVAPGLLTSVWGVENVVFVIRYFLSRYF